MYNTYLHIQKEHLSSLVRGNFNLLTKLQKRIPFSLADILKCFQFQQGSKKKMTLPPETTVTHTSVVCQFITVHFITVHLHCIATFLPVLSGTSTIQATTSTVNTFQGNVTKIRHMTPLNILHVKVCVIMICILIRSPFCRACSRRECCMFIPPRCSV